MDKAAIIVYFKGMSDTATIVFNDSDIRDGAFDVITKTMVEAGIWGNGQSTIDCTQIRMIAKAECKAEVMEG